MVLSKNSFYKSEQIKILENQNRKTNKRCILRDIHPQKPKFDEKSIKRATKFSVLKLAEKKIKRQIVW